MTDDFFEVNFRHLKALKKEAEEANKSYREIRELLQSLNLRFESLERLMKAEVYATGNKALEKELNDILEDETPSNKSQTGQESLNKTEFLVRMLFNENLSGRGLKPKELFDLAQHNNKGIKVSLTYTNSVLSSLRKKGMTEQRDERYFLTEKGRNHWSKLLDKML